MANQETFPFYILLVMIPVAMMAKHPSGNATGNVTSAESEAIVQTKGKCNVRGIKEQIEAIKRQLDDLSTKVECCQPKGCPSGWVGYGSSCYYIAKTRFLKWDDARATCRNMGGDLAIIKSAEENNFIFNLVKNAKLTSWGAWIGLYQKPDTKFYWIDGSPLAAGYSAWASGEPNNIYPNGPINSAYMKKMDHGRWDDVFRDLPSRYQYNAPVALCQSD